MILTSSNDATLEQLTQLADRITDSTEPSQMPIVAAGKFEHADW